jgi:dienelactone hydrolase
MLKSAFVVALVMFFGSATAAELVHFDAAWENPNHCERLGYLARPAGEAPAPAVIVLHGSAGIGLDVFRWANRLAAWGYVALAPDSVGKWDRRSFCTRAEMGQVLDAIAAQRFLMGLPYVDAKHIAAIGFSMGASSGLSLAEQGFLEQVADQPLQAVVAFAPNCSSRAGVMRTPSLILIGDVDEQVPVDACRAMMAARTGEGAELRLMVYPETHHGFWNEGLIGQPFINPSTGKQEPAIGRGWLEYNAASFNSALAETRRFLHANLSPTGP